MFHSINRQFYVIALILIFLFGLGYGILAFFLQNQRQNAILIQEAVDLERKVRNLHDMFYEIRFWEGAVLNQRNPNAEKKFGVVLELFLEQISGLRQVAADRPTLDKIDRILVRLEQYETDFNQLIQFKTEQRLNRTRMDTGYQSLVSNVLRSNNVSLLKPLFNLTHFVNSYHIDGRESEYQALLVVVDYLETKFSQARLLDERMRGYVNGFRTILARDFELEIQIRSIHKRFDEISRDLMALMASISSEAEKLLEAKFLEAAESRTYLNRIFLILLVAGVAVFILSINLMATKIIRPLRSMATAMKRVENNDISARFDFQGNRNDEIVRLGYTFNQMLDTIEANNRQLLSYQSELVTKISELAARENELNQHREQLETRVADRTADLTVANDLLKKSLREKEVLLKEIHHRVKNNMQVVSSLLSIQAAKISNRDAFQAFTEAEVRVQAIAMVHEILYQVEDFSQIRFQTYLENLANHLYHTYALGDRQVDIRINTRDVVLKIDHAVPCGLIVTELLTNALKYAVPRDGEALEIRISAGYRDGRIEMIIVDNGAGLPPEADLANTETLGLSLVRELITDQLEGRYQLTLKPGVNWTIDWPKHQDE